MDGLMDGNFEVVCSEEQEKIWWLGGVPKVDTLLNGGNHVRKRDF